jgi:hypothetical protein
MPLGQLADEIVRQSREMTHTPVLVTPSYLSLRTPFFVHLIDAIGQRSRLPVRVDWYRDPGSHLLGLMASIAARQQAKSINRRLRNAAGSNQSHTPTTVGSIEITASIARPGSAPDLLVVGLCDDRIELPSWTAAVRLSGWPVANVDASAVA